MADLSVRARELLGPILEIRPMDAIDILLVTVLLAAAITWIRQNRAFLVATGILVVGLVYVVARGLGLQLTAWILQGFFAIFVIIVVVIFQEELRQLFERVALWSLRRDRADETRRGDPREALVRCLTEFAQQRTGALVVLPGRQPIARHVEGGVALGGQLSVPLLMSLFDHHSPGHDGAVVIEGDQVSRFALHLPLSKDATQLGSVGTRHAAALGLAERTDALCLVVSEERGQISVAHEGRLRRVSPPELNEALAAFFGAVASAPTRAATWRRMLLTNWAEKGIAFAMVVGLWFVLVPGGRLKEDRYHAEVRVIGLPADLKLKEVAPAEVELTLAGPARAFYLFDARSVAVTVDAGLARVGRRTFTVPTESVRVPADVRVIDVEPDAVKLDLEKVEQPTQ